MSTLREYILERSSLPPGHTVREHITSSKTDVNCNIKPPTVDIDVINLRPKLTSLKHKI